MHRRSLDAVLLAPPPASSGAPSPRAVSAGPPQAIEGLLVDSDRQGLVASYLGAFVMVPPIWL